MADTQGRTNGPHEQERQGAPPSTEVDRSQSSGPVSRRREEPFSTMGPLDLFSASPFSLMRRMSEEMDRVFGEFGFGRGQSGSGAGNFWSPAIEVADREGNYVIHAELPGLKPDEVKVEMTEDALVIQGERRSQSEENKSGVRRSERHYGQFYRSIPMPEGVNPEQVRAKFENGVLEITVPHPQQQSNRRQIPVQSGQGGPGGQGSSSGPNA